ncbi:hypothetical protein GCM10011507_01100 [Edaphobacter acidisoli]|uniref:DUF5107 domain-containing protein n=1 Tax=Edaphobacter acidisoli TaxID=2040573 RepID=A0A916VZ13_9BACT|nr:DUF5107 domain-containing protein [Edaphobacter acidisoli]GGA53737.1 hypothetical protein GCM10011507_01100 [Edaphobacter acidisoli]
MKVAHCVLIAGLTVFLMQSATPAQGQSVRAWESTIVIPTYKLGPADPNPPFPLVNSHPVYPYTMLDDLTDQREAKTYRALYLENKYLKITILPQLGGHVYSVYDKVDHREVLYRNHVIKYGLVGPRGAWISGGMEFSFPFAHTTDTVSAVESALQRNPDGSATAFVGAVDWVSNMYWQIAITLRPNTSRLEQGVTLFNATPLNHLYLFWTNTAVKATDDMQYVYPMRETISDDPFAIVQNWPVWNGVDQSWYKNNPSAIAIFARDVQRNFFGVYYKKSDYGVVHVADFRQDPGKKLWSWGTAPSGKIWDHILSDNDGSYNEIQSGRFYTQGYREFMNPRSVERWTEYWYPVRGLDGGFVEATSQMAVNVSYLAEQGKPQVKLTISPVAEVSGATVLFKQGAKVLRTFHPDTLLPLQPISYTVPVENLDDVRKDLEVEIDSQQGKPLMHWSASAPIDGNPDLVPSVGNALRSKPVTTATTSVEELYMNGLFLEKSGEMDAALKLYEQALSRDPNFVPALVHEALYYYRAADFKTARQMIARARQQDEENPLAAYASGLIYRASRQISLAEDAFWTSIHYGTALAPGNFSAAAFVELGEIETLQGNNARALEFFKKAIDYNPDDAFALADLAVAQRLNGDPKTAATISERALQIMPLLPYALAEHWQDMQAQNKAGTSSSSVVKRWNSTIDNDPQNYIAIASWYHRMGVWKSSEAVLHAGLAGNSALNIEAMAYYYLAANAKRLGNLSQAKAYSLKAASLPIAQTFPNRLTDVAVLADVIRQYPGDAHARYALGNFLFAHARYDEAATLWADALNEGFNDPVLLCNLGVYQWRVKQNLADAAAYYVRAIHLSPNDYRLYTDLDEIYEEQGNNAARTGLFRNTPTQVLAQDTVRARHALLYLETSRPDEALAQLSNHIFKPWEGGVIIHNIFVAANVDRGKQELANGQFAEAERSFRAAMQYPESFGTGEPAEPETAEQLYWLGIALQKQGKIEETMSVWQKAAAQGTGKIDVSVVFAALAEKKLGHASQAQQVLSRCIQAATKPDVSANAYYLAGIAEYYSDNISLARNYFTHVLQIDPLFWQARVALYSL